MTFRPCVVIPVYNHSEQLRDVLSCLQALNLPCLLVDDGSIPPHREAIAELAQLHSGVQLLRHTCNRGKGAAVKTGLVAAYNRGFSHALQIDADGQHDLGDVASFLKIAAENPGAVICGRPRFDASIPRSRYYGRWLTHVWVWINTGSFAIPDAMCGFRVYPLDEVSKLLPCVRGERMDFDIEILVRLSWEQIPMIWLPTRVRYDTNGVSHFRPLKDNWRISCMHARLFFLMLARLRK